MKNPITALCLFVASWLAVPTYAQQSSTTTTTTLKGEVIDQKSTHLILIRDLRDLTARGIKIPIINGKFEYVLHSEHKEKYDLVFSSEYEQGYLKQIPFISEPGVVEFTLFPMNRYRENRVKGGEQNTTYWNFWNTFMDKSMMFDKDLIRYLEDNYGEILSQQEKPDNDPFGHEVYGRVRLLKEAGVDIEAFVDSVRNDTFEQLDNWQLQYIKENPTFIGYVIFTSRVVYTVTINRFIEAGYFPGTPVDISPYIELYRTVFAPKFPNHSYTKKLAKLFAYQAIEECDPFVDFTAPDSNGDPVTPPE